MWLLLLAVVAAAADVMLLFQCIRVLVLHIKKECLVVMVPLLLVKQCSQ